MASENSPAANLLLTSAGVTTEAQKERAFEMARLAGDKNRIKVVRLSDGWQPFEPSDEVSALDRAEQYYESRLASMWSRYYLKHTLGKRATVETAAFGRLDETEASDLLKTADMLVVPGGNTYQTIRGLNTHRHLLRVNVALLGLPYIGESAGSIAAGQTLKPASIDPADTCPDPELLEAEALKLVGTEVIVHAQGAEGPFDLPGIFPKVTQKILSAYDSNLAKCGWLADAPSAVILNDKQALSVENGRAEIIG